MHNTRQTLMEEMVEKIEREHPSWPQEKVRWIALQATGVLGNAQRK